MDCGRDNERRKGLSERICSYVTGQRENPITETEEENEEHQMTERGRRKVDERNAQANRDEQDENSERHIHMLFALATHG